MKGFLSVIGMLTIAQWLFVGLLYVFINVQGKNSPETMTKLHDIPVVGGYFPKVNLPTPEEKAQSYGDSLRERLIDARRMWDLPDSYNKEEFVALMTEIKERSERLKSDSRKLEKEKLEIKSVKDDLGRREQDILVEKGKLSKQMRELAKRSLETKLKEKTVSSKVLKAEKEHNKKIAKWLNSMDPQAAVDRLFAKDKKATPEEIEKIYVDAAKLLNLMDVEAAAKVTELIDPIDFVKLSEAKRALPLDKK